MSHSHLTRDGRFKSDKYRWCPAGFFALKIDADPLARVAAKIYATLTKDRELRRDLLSAVKNAEDKEGGAV